MSLTDQRPATPPYNSQLASGIRLAPQFVNRLCSRLETAHVMPDGISGLLFGTLHDDLIVVQAFRSLMDSEIAAIEAGQVTLDDAVRELARAAERDPALAPLDVLGWYAFRPVGGLHEADLAFHSRQFPSMSDVALIVRRADGGFLVFEFYTRAQEGLLTEKNYLWGASRFSPAQAVSGPVEIALRTRAERRALDEPQPEPHQQPEEARRWNRFSILQSSEPGRSDASERSKPKRRLITTGELSSVPAVIAPPKRSHVPWFSSAILFAIAAGGTFAFLVFGGVPSASSGSFWRAILPDAGLNLRVEGQGDRVLLSWNRRNSEVRSAAGAILHIDDGNQHRDVHLDAAQVENGAVLYRPNSDDVSFRLAVRGQDGTVAAENLRVLDSARAPAQPVDISASTTPSTGAAPSNTGPVAAPHIWQPVATTSTVTVPQPAARLEAPAPSAQKFDLSRLDAPALPNTTSPAATIPATSSPGNSPSTEPSERPQQASAQPPPATLEQPPTQTAENRQSMLLSQSAAAPQSSFQLPANTPAPSQPATPTQNVFAGHYTPPKPVRQVLPDIAELPPSIIASTPQIDVVVTVDKNGRVTHAQVEQHGRKAARSMVIAAETAARQWVFEPARLDGRTVPSEHSIVFQFGGR